MSMPGVQIPHWAPPVLEERLLEGVERAALPRRQRQPLDGPDDPAFDLADRDEAGVDDLAVEEDRAGAALPFPAALLRARQPEVLAEDVEQAPHARDASTSCRRAPLTRSNR